MGSKHIVLPLLALLSIARLLRVECASSSFGSVDYKEGDDTVERVAQSSDIDSSRSYDVKYMFDLSVDPYENVNVYNDAAYAAQKTYLETRAKHWTHQLSDPNSPQLTNMWTQWKKTGGVVPWVTSDDDGYVPINVTQKYTYEGAPHVIFIMIDDWGYNDIGFRSTWANWTTPNLDRLKEEGILLDNYYTHQTCVPSRGAFLTGRYSLRIGMFNGGGSELPLNETTIAQELKSAGYRTNLVGKWHAGMSTYAHYPTERGFDYFYGYLQGLEDYYNKTYNGYLDVTENLKLMTDVDTTKHNAYILETKAEAVITEHSRSYSDKPMFLYYAMQLVHYPYEEAPDIYKQRCVYPSTMDDDYREEVVYNYCAMQVMLDEAIGNLTCTLESVGMADNTIIIIAGDNGAASETFGSNYPFRGYKTSYYRGGVSNTAIMHSKLIPSDARGSTYSGQTHVTDWLPTIMSLATNGQWTGSYTGATIDGSNIFEAAVHNFSSPHTEIVHKISSSTDAATALQIDMIKYIYKVSHYNVQIPKEKFDSDASPSSDRTKCSDPSLVDYDSLGQDGFAAVEDFAGQDGGAIIFRYYMLIVAFALAGIAVLSYLLLSNSMRSIQDVDWKERTPYVRL